MSSNKSKSSKPVTLHFGATVALTEAESKSVVDALTEFRSGVTAEFAAKVASTGASKTATGRKATALGRVYSAMGVNAAITSGVIGEGGLTLKAYGERYGHSSANMTALKCLGVALSKGFGPDFPEWPILSDKAGNKAYREAVDKAADAQAIAKAVQTLSAKKAGTPRTDDGSKNTDPETGQSGPEVDTLTPFEAAKAAVAVLRDTLPTLDREQFSVVEDMLTNMLVTVVGLVDSKAEQAA